METKTCLCKPPIIDSLLCYVSTARHSMKNDDIIRVCLSFYKDAHIIKSKDMLCDIINKTPTRRRNENRLLNEMKDIIDMFTKCDDDDINLPKFVADSFDGLPPTSGFEVISSNLIDLIDELTNLRKEVALLKQFRNEENVQNGDIMMIKEDLLAIKGEIRKINHNLMNDNIRRHSLLLESMTETSRDVTSKDSRVEKNSFDVCMKSCFLAESENDNAFPSAPPLSQLTTSFSRSPYVPHRSTENWNSHAGHIQDEGGSPSAPPDTDLHERFQDTEENQPNLPREPGFGDIQDIDSASTAASYADMIMINTGIREIRKTTAKDFEISETTSKDNRSAVTALDDGYQLVQNKRKRAANIVGSKKANGDGKLRGAVQVADIYLGNCNLDVTPELIVEYVRNEMNIVVENCQPLESRNKNCKSFKISLRSYDRPKVLVPEVWPEGIVCRKFFNPRKK